MRDALSRSVLTRWKFVSGLLGLSLFAVWGCLPSTPADPTAAEPPASSAGDINEALILSTVSNGAYKYSPQFERLNLRPYTSSVAAPAKIGVWCTSSDFADYDQVRPDKSGTHVELSIGATIVREVLGADGRVAKLTLMSKGPPGYNPMLGDYWFGVAKPDGTPIVDNGQKLTGKLTQCYSCHIPRVSDDYLFGVDESAQQPDVPDMGAPPDMADPHFPSPPPPPPLPPPPPPPPQPVCGDFYCEIQGGENCLNCPVDCGSCEGGGDDHGSR
jgi:hypothetical protein